MTETLVLRTNEGIDPRLHIWGWDVAGYLFLGGLVAGLLFFIGLHMRRAGSRAGLPTSVRWGAVAAPLLLGLGMFLLFLDLDLKLHVWRFYTAFRWTSPMSWGSWVLLLVFPLMLVQVLLIAPEFIRSLLVRSRAASWLATLAGRGWNALATLSILCGAALGIYTGILLGASVARPLWSSAALGPLFLASGISGAAALLALLEKDHAARSWFTRADVWALGAELVLIGAFFVGHATSTRCHIEAIGLLLGGEYTAPFWGLVVVVGVALPLLLEWLELRGRVIVTAAVPLLVLCGGLALRYVILAAGQAAGVGGDAPLNTFF
jgi:formate-dependent nitrite reductase membrane component NrfD